MSACGISCATATRRLRAALPDSRMRLCSGLWECCDCATSTWGDVREPLVKSVGKTDALNGHVRFDERGRETGRHAVRFRYRALPRLYQISDQTFIQQLLCDIELCTRRLPG